MKRIMKSPLIGPLIALILVIIVASITTPRFMQWSNFSNQILQVSIVAIMAIGATKVIITGGIDISAGAAIAMQTMVLATLVKTFNINVYLAMGLVLVLSGLMGLYNGFLVAYLRIPAFIATLASSLIFRGFSFMMNNGAPSQSISPALEPIFYGKIAGVPIVLFYILILYVASAVFMKYTQTGRQIYAIGGNAAAARLSGVNVKRVTMTAYCAAGFMTGIAAILMACRLNSGSQNYGIGMEMNAIAAAVIGGASLAGGKGSIFATLIGAVTITLVQNFLNLNSIPTDIQNLALGVIIMLAVFLDMWRSDMSSYMKKLRNKFEFEKPLQKAPEEG